MGHVSSGLDSTSGQATQLLFVADKYSAALLCIWIPSGMASQYKDKDKLLM